MSSWEFDKLIPGCQPTLLGDFGKMYLLPADPAGTVGQTYWLVGAYKLQTRLATAIREDRRLQTYLRRRRVRLGLRATDVAPAFVEREPRYGAERPGANIATNFGPQRLHQLATPARPGSAPNQRVSDVKQNVADFWDTQTPQSHHVVEFNHLAKLGLSHEVGAGDLDHAQLPCVLLAAEFHQRYISLILKETHHWSAGQLRTGAPPFYHRLYTQRSLLFRPLWAVSRIILDVAKVPVTTST